MTFIASLILLGEVSAALAAPVRHYERTNSDGTEMERVVVFARSPAQVEVFKGRNRCADAAWVTGLLDPETGQAVELIGGRLTPELTQHRIATLARDNDGVLALKLDRNGADASFSARVGERWVLYDFDFADLIAHPPEQILRREDLRFELPHLMLGDAPSFTNRGELTLTFAGEMPRGGHHALLYLAGGPALAGAQGRFWFDAADGRLIEARLPIPNHAEYQDFVLKLVREEQGEEAWQALLAEHWRDCPVSP
tara:strand:+ start:67622 stop:68383 length:762 start_codon:yes stop_codon:yes gene_type:complete